MLQSVFVLPRNFRSRSIDVTVEATIMRRSVQDMNYCETEVRVAQMMSKSRNVRRVYSYVVKFRKNFHLLSSG